MGRVESLRTEYKYKNTEIGKIPVDWDVVKIEDTCQDFASLICKDKVYNWFIFYRIKYMRKEIERLGSGSTFNEVSKKIIRGLKIPIPPLPEQKKIAEILISVDEAINRKQEIIEKTNILKKGLMQELLTRGIGHKKFKKTEIGEIPMDWEVVKLEDCAAQQKYSFVDGLFGSNLKSIHYVDEGIPVIQSQFIISGKFRDVATFYITAQKTREPKRSRVLPGDIVIAKIGMNYGASATVPENYPEAVLSGNTMKITPNDNRVVTRFLQYLLHYLRMSKAFDQIVSTTAQPAITLKGLKNLKIPLPVIKEQKKIVEILTSVDEEIEKEMAHKERLENIKKGLMQALLTGEIRVKI